MECCGKFHKSILKKGTLVSQHFDNNFDFIFQDFDKVTNKPTVKTIAVVSTTKGIRQRLNSDGDHDIEIFGDFLEKCINLNPEKRISVMEAFAHPFMK